MRRLRRGAARAAVIYNDAAHDLIVDFKHHDRTELAPLLGDLTAFAARDLACPGALMVAAPLHRRRLFTRRFNQAAMIAAIAARKLGLVAAPSLLTRARRTRPQQHLSAAARLRNVAGAFDVPEAAREQVAGAHVILVDDVLTTGATLSACARALKRAGAARVDAVVAARVVKDGVASI